MNWITIIEIIYSVIVVMVCLRIIYDTGSSTKTLAYLLFTIFVPIGGILFYFMFGINYRKRLIYSKKLVEDEVRLKILNEKIVSLSARNLKKNAEEVGDGRSLVNLLMNDSLSPLTNGNALKLLINGEEKFPELISVLESAKHHIHLEYYIYENDVIGNRIKDILIQKAREGVEVRLIYDDFGSSSIRRRVVKALRKAGVEAFPFNRVRLLFFANRFNYRNHRKIVIVDGRTGFVGGINIGDRYINRRNSSGKQYWRDTHLRIDGPGIFNLQHTFLCDWNFCSDQKVQHDQIYFSQAQKHSDDISVQIASGGPDSPASTIMLSLLKAISLAKDELLITTPYFIPGSSIRDALKVAAMSGVKVKILVPGISDSWVVNAASWSNYGDLLKAGIEIYLYQKGFIHAKTMVIDCAISVIGTANMDHRSFDLNFEVNAIVYEADFAEQVRKSFLNDLRNAKRIRYEEWRSRPLIKLMAERMARLLSPLL
jgi:cardiolipin synthase